MSSSDSDEDFMSQDGQAGDIRHQTRQHQSAAYNDQSDSDMSDSGDSLAEMASDGIPAERILSKNAGEEAKRQYLVKWNDRAYIHSSMVTESELKSGVRTERMLKKFVSMMENNGELVSEVSGSLIDSWREPVNLYQFYVDRVVGHMCGDTGQPFVMGDDDASQHIPGAMRDELLEVDMRRSMRVFHTDHTDDQWFSSLGVLRLPVDTNHGDLDGEFVETELRPPDDVKLLIKWQGGTESDATWESWRRLHDCKDELFSAANAFEMDRLVEMYWTRMMRRRLPPERMHEPGFVPPFTGKLQMLYDGQKDMVRMLLEKKRRNESISLYGKAGGGRIFAVCAFLDILAGVLKQNRPSVVVVETSQAWIWVKAIRELTSLYWTEYNGDMTNRLVVRSHEFSSDKRNHAKFDVMITDMEIFTRDDVLKNIEWNNIIVDLTHMNDNERQVGYACVRGRGDVRMIVLQDSEVPVDLYIERFPVQLGLLPRTEHILMAPNKVTTMVHMRLRSVFRTKNQRTAGVGVALFLFREILRAHIHPVLVPKMQKNLIQQRKSKMGHPPSVPLPPREMGMLLSISSGKISKLMEVINGTQVSAVICDTTSTLRVVHEVCQYKDIACGLVESPIDKERITLPFTHGVVLMTRDFASPVFSQIICDAIYFLDFGKSFEADQHIVRFLSRDREIPIYRILTYDSVEVAVYCDLVKDPSINLDYLRTDEAEYYLRVAALTTQTARERQVPDAPIDFHFPDQAHDVDKMLHNIDRDSVMNPEFWDKVFANSRITHVKQVVWKNKEATAFLDRLAIRGCGQWTEIAADIGKSPEEVSAFGRSILLHFMTHHTPGRDPPATLLSSILWFELYQVPVDKQFEEDPDFWQNMLEDSVFSNPIYNSGQFAKRMQKSRDAYIQALQVNWVLRTFLAIRQEPYLPVRYMVRIDDPLTQPDACYVLLRSRVKHGHQLAQIVEDLGDKMPVGLTLEEKQGSVEQHLDALYRAILTDIMSYVIHRMSTNYDEMMQHPLLRPFVQMLEKGPFLPVWTRYEDQVFCQALTEFSIPMERTGGKDWKEFHAITGITTKSTDMIMEYTLRFMDSWTKTPEENGRVFVDARAVIPKDADGNDIPPKSTEVLEYDVTRNSKFRQQYTVLQHIKEMVIHGLTEFRRQPGMPDDWTIECDTLMLEGIVQYGFGKFAQLWAAVPCDPNVEHRDVIMHGDLHKFREFLSPPPSDASKPPGANQAAMRLRFIIMSNRPMPRRLRIIPGIRGIKAEGSQNTAADTPPNARPRMLNLPKVDPARKKQKRRPLGEAGSYVAPGEAFPGVSPQMRSMEPAKLPEAHDALRLPVKPEQSRPAMAQSEALMAMEPVKIPRSSSKSRKQSKASVMMPPNMQNMSQMPPHFQAVPPHVPQPPAQPVDQVPKQIVGPIFSEDIGQLFSSDAFLSDKSSEPPQPATMPPASMTPGSMPHGSMAPGSMAPGSMPPGSMTPGSIPPGSMPPGSIPPGSMTPGAMPPGSMPPSSMTPGAMAPGALPPGSMTPGTMAPGSMPPGSIPPGSMPPGAMPPGSMPHGSMPPGSMPPGSMPHGSMPPGSMPHGAMPPGSMPPPSMPTPPPPMQHVPSPATVQQTAASPHSPRPPPLPEQIPAGFPAMQRPTNAMPPMPAMGPNMAPMPGRVPPNVPMMAAMPQRGPVPPMIPMGTVSKHQSTPNLHSQFMYPFPAPVMPTGQPKMPGMFPTRMHPQAAMTAVTGQSRRASATSQMRQNKAASRQASVRMPSASSTQASPTVEPIPPPPPPPPPPQPPELPISDMSPMEQPVLDTPDISISGFGAFDIDHHDSPIHLDEPFVDNDSGSAIFGSVDLSGMNAFGNVGMNDFDSDRATPSVFDKDPTDVLDPSVTSLTLDDPLVAPEPRISSPLSMDVGGLEPPSERSPKSGVPSHPTTPQQSPPKPPPVVPAAPTMPAVGPYGYGAGFQNQNNFRYSYPTFPNQGQQFTPNQFPNMPYGNFPFGYNMPPVFNGQFQNAGFTGREAPGAYTAPPNPMFNMQHPGVVMPHPMGMTPEMMGQVAQPNQTSSDGTLIDKPKPARKQRRRGDDLFETVDDTNVSKGTRSRPRKIGKRSLSLVMPNIPHKLTLIS